MTTEPTEKFSEDPRKNQLIVQLLSRTGFSFNGKMTRQERTDLRKERREMVKRNRWDRLSTDDLEIFLGVTATKENILKISKVRCSKINDDVNIRTHLNGQFSCAWDITSVVGRPECNGCPKNTYQSSALSAQA